MSDGISAMNKWEVSAPEGYEPMPPIFAQSKAPESKRDAERMTRGACLDAARACVLGSRVDAYGKPEDVFKVIAQFWSSYTGHRLVAHDVAAMMALLKIARIAANPGHADSFVDGIGYLACGAELAAKS